MYEKYATGSKYDPIVSFCEHGTENCNSVYAGTFLGMLTHHYSMKNNI
jgi:hypothetical protein